MYTILTDVIDEKDDSIDCAEYTVMKFIIMATEDEKLHIAKYQKGRDEPYWFNANNIRGVTCI